MSSEVSPIIIDNGSSSCKVGFAVDKLPRAVFPSIVGRPKVNLIPGGVCVGAEAFRKRGLLNLKRPIERGTVVNWDDIEEIWHHAFRDQLHVVPEKHPVLLTEAAWSPKPDHEKMTQIMFEKFHVPSLAISSQAVLSLYASGRVSGLVLDSGAGSSSTVPVYEGFAIPIAIIRTHFAGDQVTDHLAKLLTERGYAFTTISERQLVCDMKEKFSFVALDFEEEMKKDSAEFEKSYELPDGEVVTVGNERFRAAEGLFTPRVFGSKSSGIHMHVYESIMKCDSDLRGELFGNIVLSGGTTMIEGFGRRIEREVAALAPATTTVKTITPSNAIYSSWVGGSLLASLSSFQWISRAEYDDIGPNRKS